MVRACNLHTHFSVGWECSPLNLVGAFKVPALKRVISAFTATATTTTTASATATATSALPRFRLINRTSLKG